ncbi:hypothetical protein SELMODRAFT_430122 [Selaginella moellendorffii]|uniref:Uncharacterized protein n=1 Tax=Selaginella moellendorffii TaxID=88036 RepID=D8T8F0_SELML|nr:hypothetical protein SELMODRAFT_430122 [Selaginella moellendorffii]
MKALPTFRITTDVLCKYQQGNSYKLPFSTKQPTSQKSRPTTEHQEPESDFWSAIERIVRTLFEEIIEDPQNNRRHQRQSRRRLYACNGRKIGGANLNGPHLQQKAEQDLLNLQNVILEKVQARTCNHNNAGINTRKPTIDLLTQNPNVGIQIRTSRGRTKRIATTTNTFHDSSAFQQEQPVPNTQKNLFIRLHKPKLCCESQPSFLSRTWHSSLDEFHTFAGHQLLHKHGVLTSNDKLKKNIAGSDVCGHSQSSPSRNEIDTLPSRGVTVVEQGLVIHTQEYIGSQDKTSLYTCRLLVELFWIENIYLDREFTILAQKAWWYFYDPVIYVYGHLPHSYLCFFWVFFSKERNPTFVAARGGAEQRLLPHSINTRAWASARWIDSKTHRITGTNLRWNRGLNAWKDPREPLPKRTRCAIEYQDIGSPLRLLITQEVISSPLANINIDWDTQTIIVRPIPSQRPPIPRPQDVMWHPL